MNYTVRYTREAREDLRRLYQFLLRKDLHSAECALGKIRGAMQVLEEFPFTCRKAEPDNPFLRELVISFGSSGYVALFEIEAEGFVTILAVRQQREEDYR